MIPYGTFAWIPSGCCAPVNVPKEQRLGSNCKGKCLAPERNRKDLLYRNRETVLLPWSRLFPLPARGNPFQLCREHSVPYILLAKI
jgi:hypothetical protein